MMVDKTLSIVSCENIFMCRLSSDGKVNGTAADTSTSVLAS
jgi:hypothetical protein